MSRPKIGIEAQTEEAILGAIAQMAQDRSLPRTAASLAGLAAIGRATLYRAFEARPELRDSFGKLTEKSPRKERSRLERDLAERLAEIHLLKQRITALTTTIEHLIRDNSALRQSLAQPGPPPANLSSYHQHRPPDSHPSHALPK